MPSLWPPATPAVTLLDCRIRPVPSDGFSVLVAAAILVELVVFFKNGAFSPGVSDSSFTQP